jgi:tRNA1Val (adenine37-N6)-methyltransferase
MSNNYFRFKQFTVQQDKCAMKVSTDACIQGAWTPVDENVSSVLDIGTGTGLLSLMLAQRSEGIHIDAIELDEDAATQAVENITSSPWKDRIEVIHADVRNYVFNKQYDMVICNPPFFNNSLLGSNDGRNNVRHTLSLSYPDLFTVIGKALKPAGYASVLLPVAEHAEWERIVRANGWYFSRLLKVHPKGNVPANRVVSICTPLQTSCTEEALQIYDSGGSYTELFTGLMKNYYLRL